MQGVRLGRPPGPSKTLQLFQEQLPEIRRRMSEGVSISAIAREYKIHRNTLSRYLKSVDEGDEDTL